MVNLSTGRSAVRNRRRISILSYPCSSVANSVFSPCSPSLLPRRRNRLVTGKKAGDVLWPGQAAVREVEPRGHRIEEERRRREDGLGACRRRGRGAGAAWPIRKK